MLTVKYDDFSGGYWGDASDARPNQDNKWYGRNVRVYPNGQIGPRRSQETQTLTGNTDTFDWMWVGNLDNTTVASLYYITTSGSDSVFKYVFNGTTGAISTGGTLRSGAGDGLSGYVEDQRTQRLAFGRLNKYAAYHSTSTGSFTTSLKVTRHGERAVGADPSTLYRLNFSDAADYFTWGASNYIDIGDAGRIMALVSAGNNQLYVVKANSLWLVSGVLGSTATVRHLLDFRMGDSGGDDSPKAARTELGVIGMCRSDGVACIFDGARLTTHEEQGSSWAICYPLPGGCLAWTDGATEMLVWNPKSGFERHTFGKSVKYLSAWRSDENYDPYGAVYTGAGISTFCKWVPNPASSVPYDNAYNDGTTSGQLQGVFHLPEYYSTQGKVLRVRNVTVQFTKYKATTGLTNEITAQAVAKGSYEAGDVTSTALTWSESSNSAATTGTEDSVRFSFGDQGSGNGFQIQFTTLKGVTIKEIVVQCDERARRV